MNNNKKNMQPNTASEGDNTINTKKGFLISIPSKKKSSEEAPSGIVMAKTVNDSEKKNMPSSEKSENTVKNGGEKNHVKDRNRRDNNKNKNINSTEQNVKNVKISEKNDKNTQNEQKKPDRQQKNQNNQKNNQSSKYFSSAALLILLSISVLLCHVTLPFPLPFRSGSLQAH